MPVNCRKYKTSRRHIQETEPSFLAAFLDKQVPGAKFRFITFEKDDFRTSGLTFLLCYTIPQKLIITVELATDLETAISQIIALNPSIRWDSVDFNYITPADPSNGKTAVELWFVNLSKFIDASGTLSSQLSAP